MKLLIVIDGVTYEIDDVHDYKITQGLYEQYDTVIEVATVSGDNKEGFDKEAVDVGKPSSAGIVAKAQADEDTTPLMDAFAIKLLEQTRIDKGVKFISRVSKKFERKESAIIKTRPLDLKSLNPLVESVAELVAQERLQMPNSESVLKIVEEPTVVVKQDSLYIKEKVDVYMKVKDEKPKSKV